MKAPLISVLLPVYNAEKYVSEAIDCILQQTFGEFELLLLNDGSTDNSKEIIQSRKDSRIVYIENKTNQGLIKTLNKGLFLSKGKYIARMDADDLCSIFRFEQQIAFFKQYPDTDILGTQMHIMDTQSVIRETLSAEENKIRLLLEPVVGHPTAMISINFLKKNNLYYDRNALHAEDYKLLVDSVLCGGNIRNLPDCLYSYRKHQEQVSCIHAETQCKIANTIRLLYGKVFFDKVIIAKELHYLMLLIGNPHIVNENDKKIINQISKELLIENEKKKIFKSSLFKSFIQHRLDRFGIVKIITPQK